MSTKVRTQVQIERRQYQRLKRLAHEHGTSMSEVLRRLLDQALDLAAPTAPVAVRETRLALLGAGRDVEGKRDVARQHDTYLHGRRR